uniref:Serpentine receptor class gamma n=1 Tax=Panagrellus redivivus TaxID=6233 RepID=A0A7E4VYC2_PANRE
MSVHLHNTDIVFLASKPVQICAIVQYLIGGMTLVVAPVFCYAVAYKSTKEMPTYRKFMLALIPFGILNTTLITGYQPIYFVQHQVHVSTGLFKSFGTNVLVYETMLIFAIDTFQTEILLLMLISQYFVMSKAMRNSKPKTEKIVYGFLFVSSFFYCAVIVTFFCFELLPLKICHPFITQQSNTMLCLLALYSSNLC